MIFLAGVFDFRPTETTDIENYDSKILPEKFYLSPPYPNPFNGYVKIDFGIPSRSSVELSIFNLLGQRIKTLINNEYYSGEHSINWDGTNESGENVSSGVYLIKIETEEFKSTRKTILLQ